MSLETLAKLRRARKRPQFAHVVLGDAPAWFGEGPGEVVIRPADRPEFLDLRALVGIPIHVIELARDDARFEATVDALLAAGAHIDGLVSWAGATAETPEYEAALVRLREQLCQR